MLQVYQVEFDYTPAKADELALVKGQYLSVLLSESEDWWITYNLSKQQIGWTPLNFLKKVEYATYNCDFDYAAENDDELNLKEGDTVYVLDKTTSIDGWFYAMIETFIGSVELLVQEHGLKYSMYKIGLVPSNFITQKPKTKAPPVGGVGLPKGGTIQLKPTKTFDRDQAPTVNTQETTPTHKASFNVSTYADQAKSATIKKGAQNYPAPTYISVAAPSPVADNKSATIKKNSQAPLSLAPQSPTSNSSQGRKDDSAKSVKQDDFPLRETQNNQPQLPTQTRKASISENKSFLELQREASKLTLPAKIERKDIGTQTFVVNPVTLDELQWYVDDNLLSIKTEMYAELEKIRRSIKK